MWGGESPVLCTLSVGCLSDNQSQSVEKAFRKCIPEFEGQIRSGSHWHICNIEKQAPLTTQNLTKAENWSTR